MFDFFKELSDFFEEIGNEIDKNINKKRAEAKKDFENSKQNIRFILEQNEDPTALNIFDNMNSFGNDIENTVQSLFNIAHMNNGCLIKETSSLDEELNIGDHIFVRLPFFTHHGLYAGNNKVIHYKGMIDAFNKDAIEEVSINEFSSGKTIYKLNSFESPVRFSEIEVLLRAYSRIGEKDYNFICNNCENFVRWCRFGPDEIFK